MGDKWHTNIGLLFSYDVIIYQFPESSFNSSIVTIGMQKLWWTNGPTDKSKATCSSNFSKCGHTIYYELCLKFKYQRTSGHVNAHLISWPSKAQNIQNLENIY